MAVNEIGSRPDPIVGRAETISQQLLRQVPYTVTDVSTSTTATIYSDPEMTTPISSPTTDAEGEYEFYLPPGLYSIAFTTSERVNQPPNFRVWNGNGAASNVYVRSDPYIDPRHPSYGNWTTNPTASLQAAVTEWSTGPNPNILIPPGDIYLTSTITGGRKNGSFRGMGKHSRFRQGPVNAPMFLFTNTGHINFSDFSCLTHPTSGTVTACIELRYNHVTNTGGAPSGNRFTNLHLQGVVPQNLTDGILYSKAAGSNDANNDLAEFEGIYGGFGTGSLLRFTHSQSKGHTITGIHGGQMPNVVSCVDNTGNGNAGGHFSVFGGTVGNGTGSAFVVDAPRETIVIVGVHAENTHRLFEQVTGNTGFMTVAIIGCSNIGTSYSVNPATGAGTPLDAPEDEIIYFSAGSLIVQGCLFRRTLANNSPAASKQKISLAVNPTFGRCTADISFNNWDSAGTFENADTLVKRQPSLGSGHIVRFEGNKAKNSAGTTMNMTSRRYGLPSNLGTFTTATRPTSANDLSDGDSIYDSDLDKPAWWRASDSTWRDATGAAI